MMLIRSSDDFTPAREGSAMLIENMSELVPFAQELNNVTFYSAGVDLHGIDEKELVVCGSFEFFFDTLSVVRSPIEYWVPKCDEHEIQELLENSECALLAAHSDESWAYFRIARASDVDHAEVHEANEMFFGYSLRPRRPEVAPVQAQVVSSHGQSPWRNQLISRAIPIMKPIKPYLPSRVVVMLYKTLDRIR